MNIRKITTYNVPFEKESNDRFIKEVETKLSNFKVEELAIGDQKFSYTIDTTTTAGFTIEAVGKSINNKESRKFYAFMDRFKILGDIYEGNADKKSLVEKMSIMQSKAEFYNQGALMMGIFKTKKLKDKNGNEVRLWDAFIEENETIVWNTELMGEQKEVPMSSVYSKDMNQVNESTLSSYLAAVNRIVHGDYKNKLMIK